MNYKKRFSRPHYDLLKDEYVNAYYTLCKNTPKKHLDEIHDVYFGKTFTYEYNGEQRSWGNAMGVEASDEGIDNLFRIQDEFGIEISLTMNSLNIPSELLFGDVLDQFINWLGDYYKRGLRSCTISSEHLMRSGVLHKNFPEMRWKSTVNQICADAQQFVDMVYLGYDTILLDRSLNRNMQELKRIKKAQDRINKEYESTNEKKILTSLLVKEGCMYRCPFKQEHDTVGEFISHNYFSSLGNMTCNRWREARNPNMPRIGVDIAAIKGETMKEYLEYVDILKYSGRFTKPASHYLLDNIQFAWMQSREAKRYSLQADSVIIYSDTMEEIIENDLAPITDWNAGVIADVPRDWKQTYYKDTNNIWFTEKGVILEKLLKNCRSQCWDCHECERLFGGDDFDSLLQL